MLKPRKAALKRRSNLVSPAAAAGNEEAMISDTWGSPSLGWGAAG